MMKRIIIFFIFTTFITITHAETCPTIKEIKSRTLNGWKAYDSDDGTPLSSTREIQYKKTIQEFALAEWGNKNNQEGTMHCYYRDATGSSLEAYLAKKHFAPQNHQKYWYQVSGYMHCAAGMDKCRFVSRILENQKQFAKN
jgi:hypothetical protein